MKTILLPILLVMMASPFQGRAQTVDAALKAASEQLIIPSMVHFVERVESLSDQTKKYCSAPTVEGMETLQQGWRTMMNGWQFLYPMLIGPMEMGELETPALQIDSRLMRGRSYDRVIRAVVNSSIAGRDALDEDFVMELMFKFKGVHAVEYLLFEKGSLPAVHEQFVAQTRRCDLLQAYLHDIHFIANNVKEEWLHVESETFPVSEIGRNNFVNKILEMVIFTTKRKLIPGKAGGDALESRLSGNSLENIRQILKGAEASLNILLESDRQSERNRGNQAVHEALQQQFGVIFSKIEGMSGPLEARLKSDRASVDQLIDEIIVLEKILKKRGLKALGVKQGFNFNDGD